MGALACSSAIRRCRYGRVHGNQAEHLKTMMERTRSRMQDQDLMRDREIEQHIERLREHMETMAKQMEEGLQMMERMTERMRQHQPQ